VLNIIITLDYEIIGNGTGNVKDHMIIPTEKILRICDRYEVPLTIMFEISEYLKFIEYDAAISNDLGYSPSEYIREQVVNALRRGHDVQLHIHPQWVDAVYKNKQWIIQNLRRSITDLSQNEINELIRRGKVDLEKLLRPNDSNYICCAMRLTNMPWSEAPPEVILPMKKNGIKVHSLSVSSNLMNNEKGYWQLDSENDVFEIPIHSLEMPILSMMLKAQRIRTALYRRRFTNKVNSEGRNEPGKLRLNSFLKLFSEKYSFKWDFCKQSAREMLRYLNLGMRKYNHQKYEIPLIMISHSKDFFNEKNLDKFLMTVKNTHVTAGRVEFSTLQEFIKNNLIAKLAEVPWEC